MSSLDYYNIAPWSKPHPRPLTAMANPTEPPHCALTRECSTSNLPSQSLAHRERITAPDSNDFRGRERSFPSKRDPEQTCANRQPKLYGPVGGNGEL
jgi:hypothetical protein